MTRTAVACPEPERRRNEPISWITAPTTSGANTTAWIVVDIKR